MLRRFLLPVFFLALPFGAAAAACGVNEASSMLDTGAGSPTEQLGEEPGTIDDGADAAGVTKVISGSPLCGDVTTSCSPDEDGAQAPTKGACAFDGGAASLVDASEPAQACRIVKNVSAQSSAATACTPASADVKGVDGVACKSANDCAPGFDCVDGESGAVCRRYCCGHTCEGVDSQNGGPTFCDVQPVVRPTPAPTPEEQVKAPVCMPIKACTLLEPGGCGRKESCAVVTPKGDTGCVSTDTQQAGESCEAKHCAEGLTCLGSPGDRTCYKLCRMTDGAACGPTQKCTTGATFKGTNYGVCRD
ncbi:MAG: hypothetical protein KIT84_28775 [Labilithrix sp.]|nr:hypothetical protein [Labilithrix sp.]MCW5815055.1 hypothetical protein [Labilithrix sp.]